MRVYTLRKPLDFDTFHKRITKYGCIAIWCCSLLLNTVPIICTAPIFIGNYDKDLKVQSYIFVLHAGVTTPLVLTILMKLYLSLVLTEHKRKVHNFTKQDAKRSKSFQKLMNGLVIWLIVCNSPYIGWYHYSLWVDNYYSKEDQPYPWIGLEGVCLIVFHA